MKKTKLSESQIVFAIRQFAILFYPEVI